MESAHIDLHTNTFKISGHLDLTEDSDFLCLINS